MGWKVGGVWIAIALGTALAFGITVSCSAASKAALPGTGYCRAAAPLALSAQPARWLGNCVEGKAEGVGVMRAGSAEPYQFFIGEMHVGIPVRGMLRNADGWEMAAHFDEARLVKSPRSWDPQDSHAMYLFAAHAAETTAIRFLSSGNRGSAAYYRRLAQEISDGEPE